MNKVLGFTLIELMLTLFLSSFILMSLTTIFMVSKKNDDTISAFMQLQDNIDMSSHLLTRAIQVATHVEPYQGPELKPATEGMTVNDENTKKSFFIAKTDRTHTDGSPIYALYVKDTQGKRELIENVLDMQMQYSYFDHGMLKESKAEAVTQWSAILGVSIALLFSSMDLKKEVYLYAALHE